MCTNGAVSTVGDHAYATCIATDVADYVYVGTCNASATTGQQVTCGATQSVQADATVPSCTNSQTIIGGKQTTVTCSAPTTSAPVNSPSCSSYVSGTDYVTCGQNIVSGPATNPGCVNVSQVGSGTYTQCSPGSGPGYKLRVTTTITTTTSQMSGTAVVGTPTSSSSTGSPVVLTACEPTTDPSVVLPSPNPKEPEPPDSPSPPTMCTSWPCVISSVTVPTGSQNSVADVAQYYYKTDLRPDNVNWPDVVKPVGAGAEADTATHQHMTTFVVGLGVSGTLDYRSDYRSTTELAGDFPKIRCVSPPLATPAWVARPGRSGPIPTSPRARTGITPTRTTTTIRSRSTTSGMRRSTVGVPSSARRIRPRSSPVSGAP